jgi:uncharacterized damage-inducible protein DinB
MPEAQQMDPMVEAAFGDVSNELASTRKMIAAVPAAHFSFRPNARSMSLGQLATHVVNLAGWGCAIMESDGVDIMKAMPSNEPPATTDELVTRLDEGIAAMENGLRGLKPADLAVPWTLRMGEHVIMTAARGLALRSFCISHIIHHRAQLAVYLRLVDQRVPGMYGPSADEK